MNIGDKKKWWLCAVSLLATAGLLSSGCVAGAPPPAPKATAAQAEVTPGPGVSPTVPALVSKAAERRSYGGSVTRVTDKYPENLDPHFSRGINWYNVLAPAYNGLFMLDERMEIVPDLVEKWEQPNDSGYLLHLRNGVRFHDTPAMKGREFTAEDVKYNIQRISTEDPRFFRRWQFQIVSNIEILDKYTVRLTLKEPTPSFMDFMAQPLQMVGREAVERFGDLGREEAGTGPFYLKSWTDKLSYKLAKNSEYFIRGIPYLDEVNVVVVPDSATRLAAFRSRRTDYALVSNSDLSSLKRTNTKMTSSRLPTNQVFMVFHPNKKPFNDQRVRQALSLAVDRQAVIDVAMEGAAEISGSIYGVAASWTLPLDELKRLYQPDIPRAKKLMADAGYLDGFPLEVKVSSRRKDSMDALVVLTAQLKQIGIDVKQQTLEHTTVVAQRDAGDYVALLHGGTAALEPGERISQYWRRGGMYHVDDSELTKLIDEQQRTVDVAKRRQLLNQFERVMIDKAYALFLFGYGDHLVRQPNIGGPPEPSVLSQHLVAYHYIEK
ncbi:MAG: ABC transporter substrate-binding protein [Chloroflexi bacterium]|nr:ABC transporter substrate-binding protein [Chloroflexota bacterium]